MAKLSNTMYPWKWYIDYSKEMKKPEKQRRPFKTQDDYDEENKYLEELCEKAYSRPRGSVLGAVYYASVADGHAYYIVTNEKPLTLSFIPYGDAYRLPYPYIRGLTKQDILDHIARERSLKKLFHD